MDRRWTRLAALPAGALIGWTLTAWALTGCVLTQAPAALAGPACSQAVGSRQAEEYVRECLEVSPATHPPCNVANPCALILDEVARGCAMLPSGSAPAFCARRERRNVGRDE